MNSHGGCHGYGEVNSQDYHTAPRWYERVYDAL